MSLIIFIIVLILVLSIHELGHFILAKIFGVRVDEFGIGYPPRIWGKKIKNTIYSINWLPFGAFVKILGEDGDNKGDINSFANQKPWKRFAVLSGGIIVNLVCGMLLLGVGYTVGLPVLINENEMEQVENPGLSILSVSGDSPAESSGLKAGDIILSAKVGEEDITTLTPTIFSEFIKSHLGKEINLTVKTTDGVMEKVAVARENPPEGQGALGVSIGQVGFVQYGFFKSMWLGIKNGFHAFINTFVTVYYLIKGLLGIGPSIGELVGPIGITALGSQSVKLGLGYLLQFLAGISINLAAVNAIPLPALDGGRILFVLLEKIKGKPVKAKTENIVHTAGFALLIVLSVYIAVKDVIRLF
ncbi:MAG TPA: M50 family metallopeptidase [Candidatus Paceibacterota bacterium]|nr:M50 family metallopeptidase [Candidatus Paceibacterota bacterium]HPT40119.1 M50 family metallopeptidase [Candidatus Paceibacterota bacterium]